MEGSTIAIIVLSIIIIFCGAVIIWLKTKKRSVNEPNPHNPNPAASNTNVSTVNSRSNILQNHSHQNNHQNNSTSDNLSPTNQVVIELRDMAIMGSMSAEASKSTSSQMSTHTDIKVKTSNNEPSLTPTQGKASSRLKQIFAFKTSSSSRSETTETNTAIQLGESSSVDEDETVRNLSPFQSRQSSPIRKGFKASSPGKPESKEFLETIMSSPSNEVTAIKMTSEEVSPENCKSF